MASARSGSGSRCDESPLGLASLINAANRFQAIDFPRSFPLALHSFSTGNALLRLAWLGIVENRRFVSFLLDDGGGISGSA